MTAMTADDIALMAHEMIRAFNAFHGDTSLPAWDHAPAWQREATFDQVRFHTDNPDADDAATHDAWMARARRAGWTWGPVKDAQLKQNPAMVPFDQLSPADQITDRLFRTVVRVGLGR